MVSWLHLKGLFGAGDMVGLLGAGDTGAGGCRANTEGSGTSFAASANLSSRSTFGPGGKALVVVLSS